MVLAMIVVLAIIVVVAVFIVRCVTEKSPVNRVYGAHDLAMEGLHEEAIAEYDKAIKDFTWAVRGHSGYMDGSAFGLQRNWGYDHLWLAYAWKALSLCALGMPEEALEATDVTMEHGQGDARVRYAGVAALGACGLHEEAQDLAGLCIGHDPRAAEFYYAGVLVMLEARRAGKARRLAAEAISHCPDGVLAHASRAMVLWKAGDASGALDAIDRSVSHAQDRQARALHVIRGEVARGGRPGYGELAVAGARRDP